MRFERENGFRLGCVAVLFASCFSFQNDLHRISIPSSGLQWRLQKSIPPTSKRSSSVLSARRSSRNLLPLQSFSISNFAISMINQTTQGTNDESNNISINGNENNIVDENNNFVQNRTNNIKIEENDNYIEKNTPIYKFDVSKHYFDEMEHRSGKDYRWIKPLTKPVSHVMRYVDLFGFPRFTVLWERCEIAERRDSWPAN